MRVVDRLGSLQFDPLEVAGRNHDLTLLARVAGYRRTWTDELLYGSRDLYETYNKQLSLVPTAELPWYRLTWDREHEAHSGGAFDEHAPLVEELLERIRTTGPMSSTDLEPREAIDWYWRPTNPVRAILEALAEAGHPRRSAGVTGTAASTTSPSACSRPDILARRPPERDQRRHKLLSRYRGNGLLGASGRGHAVGRHRRRPAAAPSCGRSWWRTACSCRSTVEGVRGTRYVLGDELPILDGRRGGGRRRSRRRGRGRPAHRAARRPGAGRRVPRPARPARVGPGPAALAVGLRLPLGGLRPGREAPLGLLRAPAPVRRPARRADRAADRPARPGRCGSSACGGSPGSIRSTARTRGSPTRSWTRSRRISRSRTCAASRCPASCATARSRRRSGSGSVSGRGRACAAPGRRWAAVRPGAAIASDAGSRARREQRRPRRPRSRQQAHAHRRGRRSA